MYENKKEDLRDNFLLMKFCRLSKVIEIKLFEEL